MFRKTQDGFSIEANGYLVEVNFGPNSGSDNKTVSRKAFEAEPKSPDAEIKATRIDDRSVLFHEANCSPEDLNNLLHNVLAAVR